MRRPSAFAVSEQVRQRISAPLVRAALWLLAAACAGGVHAEPRHTAPMSIHDVRSFDYFIAPGFAGAPRGGEQFRLAAAEDYDLFIANYTAGHDPINAALLLEYQDSAPRGRLAIAYLNAGEFMRCCSNIDPPHQASWFDSAGAATAAAPAWLGPPNPSFPGLWSARNWDPEWQRYVLGEIERIAALGFDGVFLDMLYTDTTWGPRGFAAGRAGIAGYRVGQLGLAKAIWELVHTRLANPRFIVITNYSSVLDDNAPALTEGLQYADAFMKESEYFGRDDRPAPWTDHRSIQQYFAARNLRFYAPMLRLNKVVLMQSYDLSFANFALMLRECARYGYLLSNTHFPQNLTHLDGLPVCTRDGCSVTNAAGQHAAFARAALAP